MRYMSQLISPSFSPFTALWFLSSLKFHFACRGQWRVLIMFLLYLGWEWWFCSEREVGVCPLQRFFWAWADTQLFTSSSSRLQSGQPSAIARIIHWSCCSCVCECLHNKCLHVAGLHLTSSLTVAGDGHCLPATKLEALLHRTPTQHNTKQNNK